MSLNFLTSKEFPVSAKLLQLESEHACWLLLADRLAELLLSTAVTARLRKANFQTAEYQDRTGQARFQ